LEDKDENERINNLLAMV